MAKMTTAERKKVVASLIKTSAGRQQLAAALQQPLRIYRDYEAVGRRAFMVDELDTGSLPYYDKDPDVISYIVGEEGVEPITPSRGDRVFVPMFEIATNPMVPITQIRQRKFDIENRVKEKAKAQLFRIEDQKIFALMSKVMNSNTNNAITTTTASGANIDTFNAAMAEVEKHGNIRAQNIFLNPVNLKIIRRLGKDYFDPVSANEVMKTGFIGYVFGLQVHTSPVVPANEIYVTGESEFFGVMPIGIDITVLSADSPKERMVGFSIFSQLGVLCSNSNALAGISIA